MIAHWILDKQGAHQTSAEASAEAISILDLRISLNLFYSKNSPHKIEKVIHVYKSAYYLPFARRLSETQTHTHRHRDKDTGTDTETEKQALEQALKQAYDSIGFRSISARNTPTTFITHDITRYFGQGGILEQRDSAWTDTARPSH